MKRSVVIFQTPKVNYIFSRIAHLSGNPPQNEKGTDYHLDNQSLLADQTGLEPVTHGSTIHYSNQLNY